jgi:hypothetical protein
MGLASRGAYLLGISIPLPGSFSLSNLVITQHGRHIQDHMESHIEFSLDAVISCGSGANWDFLSW